MGESDFEQRLFCPCGKFSVHDNGFQDEFFRRAKPCPKCGRSANSLETRVVRWAPNKPPNSATWWEKMFRSYGGKWEEAVDQ